MGALARHSSAVDAGRARWRTGLRRRPWYCCLDRLSRGNGRRGLVRLSSCCVRVSEAGPEDNEEPPPGGRPHSDLRLCALERVSGVGTALGSFFLLVWALEPRRVCRSASVLRRRAVRRHRSSRSERGLLRFYFLPKSRLRKARSQQKNPRFSSGAGIGLAGVTVVGA